MSYRSIKPGQTWLDTDGKRIIVRKYICVLGSVKPRMKKSHPF